MEGQTIVAVSLVLHVNSMNTIMQQYVIVSVLAPLR